MRRSRAPLLSGDFNLLSRVLWHPVRRASATRSIFILLCDAPPAGKKVWKNADDTLNGFHLQPGGGRGEG